METKTFNFNYRFIRQMDNVYVSIVDVMNTLETLEKFAIEERNPYATYLLAQTKHSITEASIRAFN